MTALPGTHITFSDFISPRIEDFTAYAATIQHFHASSRIRQCTQWPTVSMMGRSDTNVVILRLSKSLSRIKHACCFHRLSCEGLETSTELDLQWIVALVCFILLPSWGTYDF